MYHDHNDFFTQEEKLPREIDLFDDVFEDDRRTAYDEAAEDPEDIRRCELQSLYDCFRI